MRRGALLACFHSNSSFVDAVAPRYSCCLARLHPAKAEASRHENGRARAPPVREHSSWSTAAARPPEQEFMAAQAEARCWGFVDETGSSEKRPARQRKEGGRRCRAEEGRDGARKGGQLGLKLPAGSSTSSSKASSRLCDCEIRLGAFPAQTAHVPLIHSPEFNTLDPFTNAAVFSLGEPDLRALAAPGLFFRRAPRPRLEVAVYLSGGGGGAPRCWRSSKRRLVGVFGVELAPELREGREGKPVLLHHGWAGIGKGAAAAELHLRVKMEADPRYIFQFDDEVALSPQVVQLHGRFRQPIFSCKFIRDRRRPSQSDWSSSGGGDGEEEDAEMAAAMMRRKERKGWKVVIHDLSGSAVAAAFMATPFVPAPGGDTVARSNPGAWLIVRAAGTAGPSDSWQPWGRLEAWRESPSAAASSRDTVRLRLHLLPDGHDDCVLVSEAPLGSEKGGEFAIDMDRQAPPPADAAANYCAASLGGACAGGGFVMSCRVEGEARSSRPVVQLATRHVTCMEDAALFVALAAAVDLSVKACRPFPRKITGKKAASSPAQPDPLELDT